MRTRLLRALALLGVLALLLGGQRPDPAAASPLSAPWGGDLNCVHGGNWLSTACFHDAVQSAVHAEWHNNGLFVNNALITDPNIQAHENVTIVSWSNSPCVAWVEQGLTEGFHGQIFYGWYWAWDTDGTIYSYRDFQSAGAINDGSNHTYDLKYLGPGVGGGRYQWLRDGGQVDVQDGFGFGTCTSSVGLEVSRTSTPPNGDYRADTFDIQPLTWTDMSGIPHTGWNMNEWYIDYPCDGTNVPPNCLNGIYYSPSYWATNKP